MDQNGLFRFSMDHAMEIIFFFDQNGVIRYANQSAERQLEYGKDELCGCLLTDVFPGETGRIKDFFNDESPDGKSREIMLYRKNRTCFPAMVRMLVYEEPQAWKAGQKIYLCMAQDVSKESYLEKKASRADWEAGEAQKVKSEFVANVTHELRTPVNGILGNTQELIQQETEKDKLKLLRMMERGCRDMISIINNILDFSKLEAGKFILESRKFHFRDMLDYVKGNHINKITEKGLDFSITVSPDIPEYIIGDELRIVQVLNNLLSNACKFTAVGSIHVEVVKTAQSGKRMELFFIVTDTGIGIAKADQDKLFKSFSQVDASTSRKYGGTGLGLNICKQLVELMGGSIHVDSDAGKGTRFYFHIWVEIPEECQKDSTETDELQRDEQVILHKLKKLSESSVSESVWQCGEAENLEEIEKKMSKLILSVEMENWEKAESFAEAVKQLVDGAPKEVKSAMLRLKMAVQKADYAKTAAAFETLQNQIKGVEESYGREQNK